MEEMGAGLPAWLTTLSWAFIATAVISAGAILYDLYGRGHRQPQRVMEALWPLSALYLGPLALPVYNRFGRTRSATWQGKSGTTVDRSITATAVPSGLPGGVSSGLAHVVAVPFVVATGLTIANVDMWAMVAIITVLATALIFAFEYVFFTAKDRRVPGLRGVRPALVVATITVVAFDLGMLGWMLILYYNEIMPAAGDVRFTFLMQVGLILGTLTAYPAMRLLASRRNKAAV
ncbi:MAG: DUF4396 domain-containing protein [Actinomycetota bacterium]|nr:DUF4396 domain-containing protein [Actinomycetota bacterium]